MQCSADSLWTRIMKCIFAFVAVACAAQVLSVPVQHEGKGVIEDIQNAVIAVEEFILSCDALYNQVLTSSNNAITTIVTSVDSIIAQLGDLGLSAEELQSIKDLANSCVANIESIVTELLTDITSISSLLGEILDHLTNPIQLVEDILQLRRALNKIVEDFSTALDRILAQLVELKNSIIALLANHTGEIVDSILSDIAAVEDSLVNEYNNIKAAIDTCATAAKAALAALDKLVS